jgi:D-alanyl-D-alanine dipeptidase
VLNNRIPAYDLIPMDLFKAEPIIVDLVYAQAQHPENIFKEALYHNGARLFLHRDMARVVISTARYLHHHYQWTLVLKDGLRTIEAENAAMNTGILRANPQWLEGPNVLFSKPGSGAHPRGMAIDVSVLDKHERPVNMGTHFDEMSEKSARDYMGFAPQILEDRLKLETAFTHEAARLKLPMLPLASEWWDFRFPRIYYEQWSPLSDAELPEEFRLCTAPSKHTPEWQSSFDNLSKEVLNLI